MSAALPARPRAGSDLPARKSGGSEGAAREASLLASHGGGADHSRGGLRRGPCSSCRSSSTGSESSAGSNGVGIRQGPRRRQQQRAAPGPARRRRPPALPSAPRPRRLPRWRRRRVPGPPPGVPSPGTSGRRGTRSTGSTPPGGRGRAGPVELRRSSDVGDRERWLVRRARLRRRRMGKQEHRPRSVARVRSRSDDTQVTTELRFESARQRRVTPLPP